MDKCIQVWILKPSRGSLTPKPLKGGFKKSYYLPQDRYGYHLPGYNNYFLHPHFRSIQDHHRVLDRDLILFIFSIKFV
jgi:hypothetical protein